MGVLKLVFGLIKMAIALVMAIPITLFFFVVSLFHLKDPSAFEKSSADFVEAALDNVGRRVDIYMSLVSVEKKLEERSPAIRPGWFVTGKLDFEKVSEMRDDLVSFIVANGGKVCLDTFLINRIVYHDDNEKFLITVSRAAGLSIRADKYDDVPEKIRLELEQDT